LVLFSIGFINAEIKISEPNEVYNLGDRLLASVSINPSFEVDGFFDIDLSCGGNIINFYKIPANTESFPIGEEHSYTSYIILTRKLLGNISNQKCSIVATLGDEKVSSKLFTISETGKLELELSKTNYNPGELVSLNVKVTKDNQYPMNGFLEVSGLSNIKKAIVDGAVQESFIIPKEKEAGQYDLILEAYDVGSNGEKLNIVSTTLSLEVNQVPSFIETTLPEKEINSGKTFEYKLELYDQAGKKMENMLINSNIISPLGEEKKFAVLSGEKVSFDIPLNASPGNWKISSFYTDVLSQSDFNVLETALVDFTLLNSTLLIKNIGNTIYNKTINIRIGDRIEKLDLNILPGEERKFKLTAPEGNYDILVEDGISKSSGTMLLTGKAISINDLGSAGFFNSYPIVWFFIIFILGGVSLVMFFRFGKTKNLGESLKKIISPKKAEMSEIKEDKNVIDISKMMVNRAENVPILDGKKIPSSIILMKVLNYDKLGGNPKAYLDNLVKIANDNKGVVEVKQNGFCVVFSPLITKTYNNEKTAMELASNIFNRLEDYNNKFKEKIEFSLGVHSGELVSAIEDKKLKYTAIDNTISFLRKIVDSTSGKLLISEDIKKKMMRDLKTEVVSNLSGKPVYSVSKFLDREGDKEKLKDILSRIHND
jgi:hypothetical protein